MKFYTAMSQRIDYQYTGTYFPWHRNLLANIGKLYSKKFGK